MTKEGREGGGGGGGGGGRERERERGGGGGGRGSHKKQDMAHQLHSFSHPLLTGLDSNTHSLLPSSLTLFHHLRPTISLPVTFFTVQKSKASSRMTVMNSSTKWPDTK